MVAFDDPDIMALQSSTRDETRRVLVAAVIALNRRDGRGCMVWRGIAVTSLDESTRLLYVGPG